MQIVAGKYEIVKKIGEGGCGSVYLARNREVDVDYALKLITDEKSQNPTFLERFKREAEVLRQLLHRHTVPLRDFGRTENGQLFMVMDYCDGHSLHHLIVQEGPLQANRCLKFVLQVLDVLEEAHQQGIIHRDLKPENIMIISSPQEGEFVKVLDFGLAKITSQLEGQQKQATLTKAGAIVGTPMFMSPEQIQGGRVDPRSDIYCLGLCMYQMLTGQMPYKSHNNNVELLSHQVGKYPQPMGQLPFPPAHADLLDRLVFRAIHKDPSQRFQSAAKFSEACRRTLKTIENSPRASHSAPVEGLLTEERFSSEILSSDISQPSPGRQSVLFKIVVLGLFLGLSIAGGVIWYMSFPPPQPRTKSTEANHEKNYHSLFTQAQLALSKGEYSLATKLAQEGQKAKDTREIRELIETAQQRFQFQSLLVQAELAMEKKDYPRAAQLSLKAMKTQPSDQAKKLYDQSSFLVRQRKHEKEIYTLFRQEKYRRVIHYAGTHWEGGSPPFLNWMIDSSKGVNVIAIGDRMLSTNKLKQAVHYYGLSLQLFRRGKSYLDEVEHLTKEERDLVDQCTPQLKKIRRIARRKYYRAKKKYNPSKKPEDRDSSKEKKPSKTKEDEGEYKFFQKRKSKYRRKKKRDFFDE